MHDTSSSSSCNAHRHRRQRRHRHARKERVLHTRISEQLADDIRRFAEDLRVPASNLVRNVLEEVFAIVDDVSDDVGDLFDDLIEEAEGVRERVRAQVGRRERRRSRAGAAARSRGHRRDVSDDADIEDELRRDEARERAAAGGERASDPAPPGHATDDGDADEAVGVDPTGSVEESSAASEVARPRAAELFPDVLGWQPLVLNRDFECGRCGRALGAGESAFLGIGEGGLTQTALCGRCAGRR
jgi:hypothetical protein